MDFLMANRCDWCGVNYSENPWYHVCPDGTTAAERPSKIANRRVQENLEKDKASISGFWAKQFNWDKEKPNQNYKNELARRIEKADANLANYTKIEWTDDDKKLLRGMKIKVDE
jgi:hypothetical protein